MISYYKRYYNEVVQKYKNVLQLFSKNCAIIIQSSLSEQLIETFVLSSSSELLIRALSSSKCNPTSVRLWVEDLVYRVTLVVFFIFSFSVIIEIIDFLKLPDFVKVKA
jgi:hypothetical protein